MADQLVMLAKNYSKSRVKDWTSYVIEPKLDGIRVYCLIKDESVKFYSRRGRELKMFSHLDKPMYRIATALRKFNADYRTGAMLDGEMCQSKFNEISGAIHRKDYTEYDAVFHVFHAMPLDRFNMGVDHVSQEQRGAQLWKAVAKVGNATLKSVKFVTGINAESHDNVRRIHKKFVDAGFEGAMVKDMSTPWKAHRSHAWMKLKTEKSADVVLTGWKPGKGKYEGTLGALIGDYKGREVRCSGMTDEERDWFFKRRKKLAGMIIEVNYQLVTEAGSLRHIRFKRLRDDKERP